MAITTFRRGPQYNVADDSEIFDQAMDTPMTMGQTFFQQMGGGVVDSFGLGTVIRDFAIPQGAEPRDVQQPNESLIPNPIAAAQRLYENVRGMVNPVSDQPPMSKEQWEQSPFFRENVPFDPGMTEERAAAIAIWDDARQVREHFGSKRPFTSFFGNIAGQALDPINYIPVAGPAVKAAAVSKFGAIGGSVAVGALDAAVNTAVAGALTAGARGQYGDDVSWQRQVTEIATAALIGSVFGAVGGVIGARGNRQAVAKAEASVATLRTVQEARVVLNEGIEGMVLGDSVNIRATAAQPIAQRVQELDQPLPIDVPEQPRAVVTPTGQRVYVRPEVVDARTLTAASGDLQPRDRSRQSSDAQIEDIAINLDPARLMYSLEADRGAPIVGPDGVVESGNGRRMAIMRAAEAYPARFEQYRQALRDAGYDVPDDGVPMLVSRRTSELSAGERIEFVTGANTSAIARMSATESAMTDIHAMTENVIGAYQGGDVKTAGNRDFVRGFLGNLPGNERAALLDADGNLNADGVRRIENGLVASAYGDPGLVARFAESTDDNAKSITGAMADASGDWARMRRGIQSGEVDPALDLTQNVLDALNLISRAREQAAMQGRPVSHLVDEAVRQIDLVNGPIDPRTEAIVQAFYGPGYARAKARGDIATALRFMAQEIEMAGRPQLFADTVVSGIDIARSAALRSADAGEIGNVRAGNDNSGQGAAQSGARDRKPAVQRAGSSDTRAPAAGTEDPAFFEVEVTPGGSVALFDDPYQARHFQLGRSLIELNGLTADDAYTGLFHSLRLGPHEDEARKLFDLMGPYVVVDADGPMNMGLFARAAVQQAAQVIDAGTRPGVRFKPISILEPDTATEWARRARLEQRIAKREAAKAIVDVPAPGRAANVDLSPPAPEALPDGTTAAAAAVGKTETSKTLAAQYGVDPATGDFVEQAEIDQLIAQGRLTDADEAALVAAEEDFQQAEAYGQAMITASRCMVG